MTCFQVIAYFLTNFLQSYKITVYNLFHFVFRTMNGPWTFYLILRTIVSPLDFITDSIHSFHLIHNGHPIWGILTILMPLFAIAMSALYVLIGKCQRGDPMSSVKFGLLTLTILTQLFEAFFESIPQLLLQCTRSINLFKTLV